MTSRHLVTRGNNRRCFEQIVRGKSYHDEHTCTHEQIDRELGGPRRPDVGSEPIEGLICFSISRLILASCRGVTETFSRDLGRPTMSGGNSPWGRYSLAPVCPRCRTAGGSRRSSPTVSHPRTSRRSTRPGLSFQIWAPSPNPSLNPLPNNAPSPNNVPPPK